LAFREGKDRVIVLAQKTAEAPWREVALSQSLACEICGDVFEKLTPRHFSFNHSDGACGTCGGLGRKLRFVPELIVADPEKSVRGGALKPWREVVTPHADVASGRYQQAEFAADLWQVHLGEGSDEYRKPAEFFRRTFLTQSLKQLLVSGVQRLAGQGGDPVVQLQTNFGGGKTHSMLALYHLFSGVQASELAGVDVVMAEAGVKTLPKARRVVLVGNKISPGNPVTKPDGTVVRTLWGELAYQLGGKKAFARIAWFDATVVDGAVNGVARLVRGSSAGLRRSQSGLVRQYAAILGAGIVLVLVWFVVIRGII
jgi:hypothetical protein